MGHESFGFGLHFAKSLLEICEYFGVLLGEVGLLALILGEVEKFRRLAPEGLDQFPIAAAHGSARDAALISPMRVVPEKHAIGIGFFRMLQRCDERLTVLVLIRQEGK